MKRAAITCLTVLALTGAAAADTGICIDSGLNLRGLTLTAQPGDAYTLGGIDYLPSPEATRLDLKPLTNDIEAQMQITVHDNLSPGAGYSSPYLWEVGRGPSFDRGVHQGSTMPFPYPLPRQR